MARKRLSMRQIRQVLRLKFEHGLPNRAIAKSCSMGLATVAEYLGRARRAGLGWPLPADLDDGTLEVHRAEEKAFVDYSSKKPNWVNRTYEEMAAHYGAVVIPARVRHPKDKARAEASVLLAQRWILATLRNHTFFSLAKLNRAIREKQDELNDREMKKLGVSRRQLFEELDRPAMKPLHRRDLLQVPANRLTPKAHRTGEGIDLPGTHAGVIPSRASVPAWGSCVRPNSDTRPRSKT